jgi:hypothetical protein
MEYPGQKRTSLERVDPPNPLNAIHQVKMRTIKPRVTADATANPNGRAFMVNLHFLRDAMVQTLKASGHPYEQISTLDNHTVELPKKQWFAI